MSLERFEKKQLISPRTLPNTEASGRSFPLNQPSGDYMSWPSPIKRPPVKQESYETVSTPTGDASSGDIWSFVPAWVQNSFRGPQFVPGHFILVATSQRSPLLKWEGPDIMSASTGIHDVFQHIREKLGVYWMEWIELHITGFSPLHFPPRPAWGHDQTFHENISTYLSDRDALVAVRDDIIRCDKAHNTPYVQVIIRVPPPRLRWLA
ncbi:hypothetical protein N7471_010412 [Penicillium samsonianum]|uniref:uncharacterized protein n=1 Tax=Penicillium samsonianum TaxID=1882272 RepID=UPI0025469304|nr:uncharacterized protein N7471_010412 [Penicillium samsonianum]KAJ6125919.1 hypothetical protein N7471_010412 [Penicillium samsonianum]